MYSTHYTELRAGQTVQAIQADGSYGPPLRLAAIDLMVYSAVGYPPTDRSRGFQIDLPATAEYWYVHPTV